MKKSAFLRMMLSFLFIIPQISAQEDENKPYIPWNNGKLVVDEGKRYLRHENGTPFFWLGETGWYLPVRLDRDEAEHYLEQCRQKGFNVVQVMVMNTIPAIRNRQKRRLRLLGSHGLYS
jgi:hypothetical protein